MKSSRDCLGAGSYEPDPRLSCPLKRGSGCQWQGTASLRSILHDKVAPRFPALRRFGDPALRDLAVPGINIDPDSCPPALAGCNQRAAAAHERVEHRISHEREEFHAPERQLHRERRRVADLLLALPVEAPEPVEIG